MTNYRRYRTAQALSDQYQTGLGSFAAVAAIAGIGITFIVIFLIAGTGSGPVINQSGQSNESKTDGSQPATAAIQQPATIRLPDDYSPYSSQEYKFSFAYPKVWGTMITSNADSGAVFSVRSLDFSQYIFGDSYLSGQLKADVYKKYNFKIPVRANGAIVSPVKLGDTYSWKVVQTGQEDSTLKIGDSYNAKSARNQSNTQIYDFSSTQYGVTQGRWAFESGDNFIVVTMPIITRLGGESPIAADLNNYAIIGRNISKTMRSTN